MSGHGVPILRLRERKSFEKKKLTKIGRRILSLYFSGL